MCGRYTLTYEEIKELNEFLKAVDEGTFFNAQKGNSYGNYNVVPTHEMPVAYVNEDEKRILETMHWGFMGWKPNGLETETWQKTILSYQHTR